MLRALGAGLEFLILGVIYAMLALALKRMQAVEDGRRAAPEFGLNAVYFFLDIMFVVPILVRVSSAIHQVADVAGLWVVDPGTVDTLPPFLILILVVAIDDFVGYWRYRLMHLPWLWPVHAIHHSDREMTWLARARFHPINRLIAVVLVSAVLTKLGMPVWAIALGNLIRHHFGYFIHADIRWTYGLLRYVFVLPAMHRWHHTRDIELSGNNFATVFLLFDAMFGTFYVPSASVRALGVDEPGFPESWRGQTLYPFLVWGRWLAGPTRY